MTTEAFIAIALAYSLAFLRLARVIKPSYQYFPAWAQIALPVMVAAVGVFSDSLADDVSKLDLVDSILVALGAGLAAWKGRAAVAALVLLMVPSVAVACGPYRLPASDPCSLENPQFVQLVAECDVWIASCPRDAAGKVDERCPALRECEARKSRVCGT